MDWLLISLIAIAVFITGISKGGFSGAFGIIAVPLISLQTSPTVAAAIMLPILCMMDIFTVQKFWKKWNTEQLIKCIPAAIIGVIIGGLTASWFSTDWLKIMVGVIAVGFTLNAWPRKNRVTPLEPLSAIAGKFWCGLGGFTSFIAHAGGPPMSVYLLRANLDKTQYVATAAVIFTAINYVKLIPYGMLGQFNTSNILLSLSFIPVAFLGVQLGAWLHYKISTTVFFKAMYSFLFLTGVKLIWDGISALN
ncbi:sulfite exporter TauE/SafE family protein [Marinomonas sp. M1K-6]|uniref:Probable membrane transporter protein n=1 Tax=Marinomonas profundi TaxID=2726122 RepID=A0A847R3F1_9GAMM|nr:sulfite exporter TauE/SafE family protein [Marinomonas profundi]NLQ18461.1 sulfite exporter TauE/SafE family protein [Marinomonas profundi]UDV02780.1 sulfite exporter TauE/SafE family protein [Marinomonas profundi]